MNFPYFYESGARISVDPIPLRDSGITAHIVHTHESVRVGDFLNEALPRFGSYVIPGTRAEKSGIFVPLLVGDEFHGLIHVLDMDKEHAFDDADVRLLEALARSMSAPLQSARLFDETQRLLKETEQRNAELAVINSIQTAVGAALDFQAIVDVVGDKLREVFATGDMSIRWWDEAAGALSSLYSYEHGLRLPKGGFKPEPGTLAHRFVHEDRRPFVFGSVAEQLAAGLPVRPGTDRSRSLVIVPMLAGERLLGAVLLENHERDNAFGPADVSLLQTVASSMGVALLNAKSYEAERQRAAELAIINAYMPAPLSNAELDALINAAVSETGAASIKDMGKVMALIKSKAQGRADMSAVGTRIKARLS